MALEETILRLAIQGSSSEPNCVRGEQFADFTPHEFRVEVTLTVQILSDGKGDLGGHGRNGEELSGVIG